MTLLGSGLAFFRSISELIEVLDRSDIRADIIKELDKQKNKLNKWCSVIPMQIKP
ncbi:MAG: cell division protein ZapD [Arsenophonus sp. NEOnobi-MAG3]